MSNLLDNGYMTFVNGLVSVSAQVVLWSSFKTEEQLLKNFLEANGRAFFERHGKAHILDGRRRKSEDDREFLGLFESAASQATEFKEWVIRENNQPVFRELLVTYCSYFERLLKTIAVVFEVARQGGTNDLARQIYVPGDEWRTTTRRIEKAWSELHYDEDDSRPRAFAERWLVSPVAGRYFLSTEKSPGWSICGSAFKLRNAIVHSFARPREQVELGGSVFHPGWEVEIAAHDLILVRRTFIDLMKPFSSDPLDQIL